MNPELPSYFLILLFLVQLSDGHLWCSQPMSVFMITAPHFTIPFPHSPGQAVNHPALPNKGWGQDPNSANQTLGQGHVSAVPPRDLPWVQLPSCPGSCPA